jgi:hypothetical protein
VPQAYLPSEELLQQIRDDHRRIEQSFQNSRRAARSQPSWDMPDVLLVRNTDSGTVPPYGLMAVTDATQPATEPVVKIAKPSTTFTRLYLANGPQPIPANGLGSAQPGPIVKFAYDTGTPANGDGWGPKAGQWTATINYPSALSVFGVVDSTNKIAHGRLDPINSVIGELAGPLTAGSNATVNIYGGAAGSETIISSLTLSGKDWIGQDLPSAAKVQCDFVNGLWYIQRAGNSGCALDMDFTLSATLASTDPTATVTGITYHNGIAPTGTITVNNMCMAGASGKTGWATLISYTASNGNATYKIRQLCC